MERATLDRELLARFFRVRSAEKIKEPETTSKLFAEEPAPVREKAAGQETKEPNIFFLQADKKDLPPCDFGAFISVLCCSYSSGEIERYLYHQGWFTDEEAAEKCIERGYQITVDKAREYLRKLLDADVGKCKIARGDKFITSRSNATIGKIEYQKIYLTGARAENFFGIKVPSLKCADKPDWSYRTRYGRNMEPVPDWVKKKYERV